MNMIRHEMTLFDFAFLLQGQLAEHIAEVLPQLPVDHLLAETGTAVPHRWNLHRIGYVAATRTCSSIVRSGSDVHREAPVTQTADIDGHEAEVLDEPAAESVIGGRHVDERLLL
jgi:hypothetical protein